MSAHRMESILAQLDAARDQVEVLQRQLAKQPSAPSDAGTIRERLLALAAKWRALKEVKDIGELGRCFDADGYGDDGFRPLKVTERKLLSLCARELEAELESASALPVDEPTEPR